MTSISCICVTFGRVHELEQAIECFLRQKCKCSAEMLVVNSFPGQRLMFSDRSGLYRGNNGLRVRIVNLSERPSSLGALRNMAVTFADGEIIAIADDDDRCTEDHIANFVEAFFQNPNLEWVWQSKQFYMLGDRITEITDGSCPTFAFTKKAWREVGGYPELTVGEDRQLITRITERFKGVKIDTPPSFIYAWGQGLHHCSGLGMDKPGTKSAHARVAEWVEQRVANGSIPTGEIVLKPNLRLDYERMAKEFVSHGSKKNDCCIVGLGRYGDIVNALPIALHIHNTYATPYWMVSREFADIFDGVSYVKPLVVDFSYDQLSEGLAMALRQFPHVIQTQVWGRTWRCIPSCAAYNEESWKMAGFHHKFYDQTWKPLFDRRDTERESALVSKLSRTDKPMVLVNVTNSISSPFQQGQAVLDGLKKRWSEQVNLVDISHLKLHRIYDLLGLMDKAQVLISIDSAQLHLAAASNISVMALINPMPWLGTMCRIKHLEWLTYPEATDTRRLDTAIGLSLFKSVTIQSEAA